MAAVHSNKVSSTKISDEDEESTKESKKVRNNSVFRKVSLWLRRSTTQNDIREVQEIPGKGLALINILMLKMHGMEVYKKKIEKYQSRVFWFNHRQNHIIFCDWSSAQDFFDTEKVWKEGEILTRQFNIPAFDGYVPVGLSNGVFHSTKKEFLLAYFNLVEKEYLLPATLSLVPAHLKTWNKIEGIVSTKNIEENVQQLVNNLISIMFFGTWLDEEALETWRTALFNKNRSSHIRYALDSFDYLYTSIVRCPRIKEILVKGRFAGLNYHETIKELLFVVALNTLSLSYAIISLIGRLTTLSQYKLQELRREIKSLITDRISIENLYQLRKVESFILEVLRMHPPVPLLHGRARGDFVTESNSSCYLVKKRELVACNIHQAQRDPKLFSCPHQFDSQRFIEKGLKEDLLVFGGNMDECSNAHLHKCCGQTISMTILRVMVVYLLFCKFQLKESPNWLGKRPSRAGRPDNVLDLALFIYKDPPFVMNEENSMEVMEWDSDVASKTFKEDHG